MWDLLGLAERRRSTRIPLLRRLRLSPTPLESGTQAHAIPHTCERRFSYSLPSLSLPSGELHPAPPTGAHLPISSIGQPSPLPSLTFRHLPVNKSVTGRPLLWPTFLLFLTACPPESKTPRGLRLQSLTQSAYLFPIAFGSGEEATLKQTTPITHKHKTLPRYHTRVLASRNGKQSPCAHTNRATQKIFARVLPPFLQSRG